MTAWSHREAQSAAENHVLVSVNATGVAGFFAGTVRAEAAEALANRGVLHIWPGTGKDAGLVLAERPKSPLPLMRGGGEAA